MNSKELIIREIEQILDSLLFEILDFIQFLKIKHQQEKLETILLSESALKKDWLSLEEDEAWQHL
ncbi:MAG: DUF2281 domain-containing protein [Hydrococcus sp. C42_A2020_068]|nr:hypothetical protein Ple7327_0821 [Pleurocapsa sp. PCC 7327]MBF2018938.1 DUF2281 domain-containing protein [Hydrococcus sp. C42_A2020_068]